MKLKKGDLSKFFRICSTVCSSRERDELLYKGVRVEYTPDKEQETLMFSANGNYNAIRYYLSDKEQESITDLKPIDAVIEASKTLNILSKTARSSVEINNTEVPGFLEMKAEGKSKLRYASPEDLLPLPEFDASKKLATVPTAKLHSLLKWLRPFVSEEINKTQIVGVCFADTNAYGADETKSLTLKDVDINLPEISLSVELCDILDVVTSYDDCPEEVGVYLTEDESYVVFSLTGSWSVDIFIHKFEIKYPYESLNKANEISKKNKYSVTYNIQEMLNALDRVSIFVDVNDLVFLRFDPAYNGRFHVIAKNIATNERSQDSVSIPEGVVHDSEVLLCINFTAFFGMLTKLGTYEKEITMTYADRGAKFKAVSFHDNQMDLWFIENLIQLGDEEL